MSNENTIGTSQIDAIRKYQETNGPLLDGRRGEGRP